MNAPERIKLQAAGTSLVMRVESASQVPVGTYPEYAFVGVSVGGQGPKAVELRVPKASADRQLGRMEMVLADTIGKTLLFSRDPSDDPKKPYWGIVLVSGGKGAPEKAGAISLAPPPSVASSGAQAAPAAKEKGSAIYKQITQWVLDDIVKMYVEAGIPVTMEGTAAICATLYINSQQHR